MVQNVLWCLVLSVFRVQLRMDPEKRIRLHPGVCRAAVRSELLKLRPQIKAAHGEEQRRIALSELCGALEQRDLMAAHPAVCSVAVAAHAVADAVAAHERDPHGLQPLRE